MSLTSMFRKSDFYKLSHLHDFCIAVDSIRHHQDLSINEAYSATLDDPYFEKIKTYMKDFHNNRGGVLRSVKTAYNERVKEAGGVQRAFEEQKEHYLSEERAKESLDSQLEAEDRRNNPDANQLFLAI